MDVDSDKVEVDILDLVRDLERVAIQIPAKERVTKISHIVDKINSISYRDGLSVSTLDKLIDLITTLPRGLDQSSRVRLINNLYPINKVSNTVLFKVVSSLGHCTSKVPYTSQAALLKWLIMIHDLVEDQSVFSKVYGILFNLLDTVAIRPQLCHLLSIITRRKHIRPYRIQLLLELERQNGNEQALTGLLKVFKHFFPDVIVGQYIGGRTSVFAVGYFSSPTWVWNFSIRVYLPAFKQHPNPEWSERLGQIQNQAHTLKFKESSKNRIERNRLFQRRNDYVQKLHKSLLPPTQTFNSQESSITLEEIENVQDLVRNFEKIKAPNQLVAVLRDPLLQKFLQLKSSENDLKRVNNWLLAFFEDELSKKISESGNIQEILRLILEYTRHSKILPSSCIEFLKSMIPTWDGVQDRDLILDLLAYTPLHSFTDFSETLISPLEEAILDDESIDARMTLINFYTALLRHWIVCLLARPENIHKFESSVTALVEHANHLALTIIQISTSIPTLSTILKFYETTTLLIQNASLRPFFRIVLPEPEAVYILSFTSSLSILSRICGIIAVYKRILDEISVTGKARASISSVKNLNACLIDLCNCLWRGRAFNIVDLNSKGCLISPPVIEALSNYLTQHSENSIPLLSLFSFSFSPVTCLLAINFFKEQENRRQANSDQRENSFRSSFTGPITQSSLKQYNLMQLAENQSRHEEAFIMSWLDYKLGFLTYLEQRGESGISELIHSTVKNLSTRK
ncbi:hypothetical protein Golomagni_01837 [Golovinomyces magnicellulatus]|nr:hypothetical protein Golomagni_01837 [Golovinomyces magnicellulatus]